MEGEVKFFYLVGGRGVEGDVLLLGLQNCIILLVEGFIFSATLMNEKSILPSISINNKYYNRQYSNCTNDYSPSFQLLIFHTKQLEGLQKSFPSFTFSIFLTLSILPTLRPLNQTYLKSLNFYF